MYCRRCGTAHTDDAPQCQFCGEVLKAEASKPAAAPPNVPTYLGQAILSTLCCCLPLGITAWVFSARVSKKIAAGDYDGARRASDNANLFSWLSLGIGFAISLIYLLAMALGRGMR